MNTLQVNYEFGMTVIKGYISLTFIEWENIVSYCNENNILFIPYVTLIQE